MLGVSEAQIYYYFQILIHLKKEKKRKTKKLDVIVPLPAEKTNIYAIRSRSGGYPGPFNKSKRNIDQMFAPKILVA